MVRFPTTAAHAPPPACAAAGKARDNDLEEGSDAPDDGLQHGRYANNDGFEAAADGAEEVVELEGRLASCVAETGGEG